MNKIFSKLIDTNYLFLCHASYLFVYIFIKYLYSATQCYILFILNDNSGPLPY